MGGSSCMSTCGGCVKAKNKIT
jgi:hypothetical protein